MIRHMRDAWSIEILAGQLDAWEGYLIGYCAYKGGGRVWLVEGF